MYLFNYKYSPTGPKFKGKDIQRVNILGSVKLTDLNLCDF